MEGAPRKSSVTQIDWRSRYPARINATIWLRISRSGSESTMSKLVPRTTYILYVHLINDLLGCPKPDMLHWTYPSLGFPIRWDLELQSHHDTVAVRDLLWLKQVLGSNSIAEPYSTVRPSLRAMSVIKDSSSHLSPFPSIHLWLSHSSPFDL